MTPPMHLTKGILFAVSSLLRTGASSMSAAAAAGVGQMSGLSSEKQSAAAAAMQFPLTQRRKRRVLFTQAQVCQNLIFHEQSELFSTILHIV